MESSGGMLFVNRKKYMLNLNLADMKLSDFLRYSLGLRGTKVGCGEGGCGSCTVMISDIEDSTLVEHRTGNACLVPVYAVQGMHITTIEGIGDTKSDMHEIQAALAESHASQCGFCTPGMVMSIYTTGLTQESTQESIEESIAGNLCRCTGYRAIVEGISHLKQNRLGAMTSKGRDLAFCPKMKSSEGWLYPATLGELLKLREGFPDFTLVAGNTTISSSRPNKDGSVIVSIMRIPELKAVSIGEAGVELGACLTLQKLRSVLRVCVKQRKDHETSSCLGIMEQLRWIANAQVRNFATIGGNICAASPVSDLNPLWVASGAVFTVYQTDGSSRNIPAAAFFAGSYATILQQSPGVLTKVFLPWTKRNEFFKAFKQSNRRMDDTAIVNAGMRVVLEGERVTDMALVFGGVADKTLQAASVESALRGKSWDQNCLEQALVHLRDCIQISDNAPGGMVEYKRSLVLGFFFKFFIWVTQKATGSLDGFPGTYRSAAAPLKQLANLHSRQDFETALNGSPVGRPTTHMSAKLQLTGEAEYLDDIPVPNTTLHAALVLSSKPHAKLLSINTSKAQKVPGFVRFFGANDVPGTNKVASDEELFAAGSVTSVGQIIGVVVADNLTSAKFAASEVEIVYSELPAIFTIEEAVEASSFFPKSDRLLQRGDVECSFATCQDFVEGSVQVGGQEHFYMETNGSLVSTSDGGNEIVIISSTQNPELHQNLVSRVLGVPMHRVVCKTKRIGGGFGGKETRPALIAAAASVPSFLLQRPVKLILDREVDMLITGKRHPFLGIYKVGFSKQGKLLALDLKLYSNGGNTLDLSRSVLQRAILSADNVYNIQNVRIQGKVCYTNLPSNTAFRGFGAPQAMLIAETWIRHVAVAVGKSPLDIMELNFVTEGDELPSGQIMENCRLEQVWKQLKASCELELRLQKVNEFNELNRWKKRGLSMVPTMFGVGFNKHKNQGGALVHIYTDGTVLVTHGGVEMGQGLHTKICQIVASALDVQLESVFVSETSTDKIPNSSPTAGSSSSDLYGAAVLQACKEIKKRMEPVASRGSYSSFAELVKACYLERIDLSAHGFYEIPNIEFDWNSGKGRPFNYFTFGAACAEVEIDCLTGDNLLRRVDIVMDLGHSLNPAIDIGQIEGAFVQGAGWLMLEKLQWGDRDHPWVQPGHLFNKGPRTYKIPTVNDMPADFRVALLKDAPNPKAIHSSKAVGEPPLFLAASAFFAILEAISSARRDQGIHGWYMLEAPATPERIRMACIDQFTGDSK